MRHLRDTATCVAIWGSTFLVIRHQIDLIPPETAVAWRMGVAAVLIAAWCTARGESLRLAPRALGWVLAHGVLLYCLEYLCVYFAERTIASGVVAMAFATSPLVNALGVRLAYRTPLRVHETVGGLLGTAGVVAVFLPAIVGATRPADGTADWIGPAFVVGALLLGTAANTIAVRHSARGVALLPGMAWSMGAGAIATAVIAIARGTSLALPLDARVIGSVAYLALFGSVFAFAAYYRLLDRIGAARAGYIGVLVPIVALVLSGLFEGFVWTGWTVAGVLAAAAGQVVMRGWRASNAVEG
ncbi:MAG: EamA family transporter [Burkholderiales bacterium]|nr:EamA family transporter [Burkholderiales bacterium]